MTATVLAFLTEQDPPNTTLKPTLSSTMAGKKGKTETKKREYSSAAFGWAVLFDYVVLVSSQCFHWMKWVGESKTGHHWNWSDPESRRGGGGRISRGGARPPVSPPAWAARPDRLTLNKPRTWYSLDNHEHILRPAWLTQHGTLNLSASLNRCEPVWPSGKALLRLSGKRKDCLGRSIPLRGSPFSSKRLWFVDTVQVVTLSITSYWNINMALIAAHLNAEVILVMTV